MAKIFIDGSAGTTGLRIYERLSAYDGIELITLSEQDRKNPGKRKEAINAADIAFLCLPDDAAIEAVTMTENKNTVIIDTSTAHRTNPAWAYGFPELSDFFLQKIKASKRIAVPGCHASGFIALIYPLIENKIIPSSSLLTCHSLTGYSGGGKKMIAEYENSDRTFLLDSPRQYGLTQQHKHLKEMKEITHLEKAPVFCPIVCDFYSGMEVTVSLFAEQLNPGYTADDIKRLYEKIYGGPIVEYKEKSDEDGFLASNKFSGNDGMQITVSGNEERILLISRYDNLGKGASGAAIECMNIILGNEITKGLNLGDLK